jgi:hypothetical protein
MQSGNGRSHVGRTVPSGMVDRHGPSGLAMTEVSGHRVRPVITMWHRPRTRSARSAMTRMPPLRIASGPAALLRGAPSLACFLRVESWRTRSATSADDAPGPRVRKPRQNPMQRGTDAAPRSGDRHGATRLAMTSVAGAGKTPCTSAPARSPAAPHPSLRASRPSAASAWNLADHPPPGTPGINAPPTPDHKRPPAT